MSMSIEAWGDYACSTRPETRPSVSYDMITPSARGALWRPSTWHPGRVIRLTASISSSLSALTLRTKHPPRNTPSGPSGSPTSGATRSSPPSAPPPPSVRPKAARRRCSHLGGHPGRAAMVPQDVHYVIECHFDLTDRPPPATIPASSRTSADACAKASAITNPVSGAGVPANFREWPGGGFRR